MTERRYRLRVYKGEGPEPPARAPVLDVSLGAADVASYRRLRIPGFDSHLVVDVEHVWRALEDGSDDRVVAQATGLETIVKFGDTMQLKEPFVVVLRRLQ